VSGLYIQAIVTNQTIFLTTNLTDGKEFRLTTLGSSWLIGRNSTCSILIKSGSVSRCHAVLGCHPTDGFYMTDLGSTNGTWVNCHRLPSHERQGLRDGDLLQFGKMKVEFFLSSCRETDISLQEATYF
jgi:pSer/pThr/pTyr-binding forkhead associated (FHA) protein